MYNRCYSGRRGLKESFVIRVEEFIQKARQYKYYELDGGIRCPCLKCDGTRILKDEIVQVTNTKRGSNLTIGFGLIMVKIWGMLISTLVIIVFLA